MSEQDAAAAVVLLLIAKRKRKRTRRWCKEWYKKRQKYTHENLLKDLMLSEEADFKNCVRLDLEQFQELLELVTPLIEKKNTNMREAIPPFQRLSITLRYLATGNALEDLKFHSAISPQSLSKIIMETCDAIIRVLNKLIGEGTTTVGTDEAPSTSFAVPKTKKKNLKRKFEDDLMQLAANRLTEKPDEYQNWALSCAADLKKMEPMQQIFAKRAIADIIMEGQLGLLHRNSVKINSPTVTITSTPTYSRSTPTPTNYSSTPSPQYHVSYSQQQNYQLPPEQVLVADDTMLNEDSQ